MTELILKTCPDLPLEAETITPENIIGKTEVEITHLPLLLGNTRCEIGDFFQVTADESNEIRIEGDLRRVKRIGTGMKSGRIIIQGDVGMHLGAGMSGGEIKVFGNTGDWTGAEMRGGKIHIKGNAGHGLGGGYRGSRSGMNRGLILLEGNAGNETGALMRRGLIAVLGNTADFTGAFAVAGTIMVFGSLGSRPGAGMKRGTIIAYHHQDLLPTFTYDCYYRPAFIDLFLMTLRHEGFPVDDRLFAGNYFRYSGDIIALGKGEILIYDQRQ